MNTKQLLQGLLALSLTAVGAVRLSADVVETKNGSHIVGKVSSINAGSVVITTDYAGDITIKQSEVTSITTDKPVAVRLSNGTRMEGLVSGTAGAVQIVGADGTLNTTVAKVAASWAAGGTDPEIAALERKWAYEVSLDVVGTSGNSSQLGTDAGIKATLAGVNDTLTFNTDYNRQVTNGTKSADQFKAGVDYENNFSDRSSWFVRDEGGFDRVMDVQFYDIAAAGYGYDVIKAAKETLTFRAGLSFRDDTYTSKLTPNVNAVGMDFEINHTAQFANSSLTNSISVVPAFSDFSDYTLTHESYYELPLANPAWKLRLGINNDYNSEPVKGLKKLDTGYFTRLVIDFK